MMAAWLLWMLVLCLSDRRVTACSVQPMIIVSKHSKVSVSCPSLMTGSEELKYLLLLNNSPVSNINIKKLKPTDSTGSLFSGHFEVTASHNGVYVCKREVLYPPPFSEACHSTEVKVDVIEEQPLLLINSTESPANQSCPDRSPFIPEVVMWVVCGVLLVYSLSISCIAIVIWNKKKRPKEDTGVYMNTFRKQCKP